MSNRSGTPYSAPTDADRRPVVLGVSTVDGITPVALEVNPSTGQLQVSGGSGGKTYIEGNGSNANIADTSFFGDGLSTGILAVGNRLFNGTSYDRLLGMSGSAYVYEAYQLDSTNDSISAWIKGCTYTKVTASGTVVSGTTLFYGYTCEASSSGTAIFYDNTAASGNTILGASAVNLTAGTNVILTTGIICTTGLYFTLGGTSATINVLTRSVSK